jgi:hypothetical protein
LVDDMPDKIFFKLTNNESEGKAVMVVDLYGDVETTVWQGMLGPGEKTDGIGIYKDQWDHGHAKWYWGGGSTLSGDISDNSCWNLSGDETIC